jgi:uncharacterized repeat protein (TIGR01451 family)
MNERFRVIRHASGGGRKTRAAAIGTVLAVALGLSFAGSRLTVQAAEPVCTANSVVINCTLGGFEIDGNTVPEGGTDWQSSTVFTSAAYTPFYDLFNSTSDDIMSQGSKESDQTTWSCVNSKPPGKSDLGGANYTATAPSSDASDPGTTAGEFAPKNGKSWAGSLWFTTVNNNQFLYSNFQRFAVNGDVHLDIEFNKASTLLSSGCPTLPVRSQGDILLTYDTVNGGAQIFISAFIFNCTTVVSKGTPCPGMLGSFAPDNTNALVDGGTFAGTANISPAGTDVGVTAGAFGEAGLNLTQTIGNFTCGQFGLSYMRTRSAGTSDIANGKAEVKDLTQPVPFNPGLCPVSTLTKWQADETTQGADGQGTDESGATDMTADAALTFNQNCSLADQTAKLCGTDASAVPPPMSASPGDELVYKLIYKNTGGGAAPNPVVTDAIPAGTTYVAGSQSCPASATCIAADATTFHSATPCTSTNGSGTITELVWCLPSEAANATVNLFFEVDVAATGTPGTVIIENFGSVTDTGVTSDTGSNSNNVAATVTYSPNPALSKQQANVSQAALKCNTATIGSSSPGSISSNSDCVSIPAAPFSGTPTFVTTLASNPGPGDILEYQLTYSNLNGTSANTGVVVTDSIPANSTFVSGTCSASAGTCITDAATAANAKCTDSNGTPVATIVWCISSVAVNATDTLTFQVRLASPLDSGTVITNTANGTSDQGPTGPATVTATVTATPNLGLTKTAGAAFTGGICPSGKTCVTYTLTASNTGNGSISGQTITDTFPSGMTFVSASNGGTNSSGTVTWTGISVAAGGSTSVTLTLSF